MDRVRKQLKTLRAVIERIWQIIYSPQNEWRTELKTQTGRRWSWWRKVFSGSLTVLIISCRYPAVGGGPGTPFTPSAPQHHRVPLGSCQECVCFPSGTETFCKTLTRPVVDLNSLTNVFPGQLHQHRVHPQKARWREGGALPYPGGHLQNQRSWGIHGARPLLQLPGQSLQGTFLYTTRRLPVCPLVTVRSQLDL